MTSKWLDIIAYDDCCGCEACVSSCPHSCITMKEDDKGFLRPWIDTANCTGCNLCTKSCPILSPHDPTEPLHVYACKNSDEDIRMKSSSGGAFTAFATKIINDGGVVYGAAFNPDFSVHHSRVDNHDDLALLRGSKYVQSSIDGTYRAAKKDLALGIPVLFSGTPCQIAGLKSFLGNKTFPNLYCIEIVCHGVPNSKVFHRYLSSLETLNNSQLSYFSFRDKKNGWMAYENYAVFKNGAEYRCLGKNDPYIQGFIKNLYIRQSCSDCHFKYFKSKADITLGDFWGSDIFGNEFNDNTGISLVCINSENGADLFYSVCTAFEINESSLEKVIPHNAHLTQSIIHHDNANKFFKNYQKKDFIKYVPDLLKDSILSQVKGTIIAIINKIVHL